MLNIKRVDLRTIKRPLTAKILKIQRGQIP